MKHLLFSFFVLISFSLSAQNKVTTPAPSKEKAKEIGTVTATSPAVPTPVAPIAEEKTNAKMSFESLTVDYGTIENGSEPLRTVKFTNTGTDPLVIKSARGSCGCTVPTYPKEPIAPGQSSVIEIRYDTKRTGKISKSVTITTNEGPDSHVLQVIGEVLPAKEDKAVPAAEPSVIKGN